MGPAPMEITMEITLNSSLGKWSVIVDQDEGR